MALTAGAEGGSRVVKEAVGAVGTADEGCSYCCYCGYFGAVVEEVVEAEEGGGEEDACCDYWRGLCIVADTGRCSPPLAPHHLAAVLQSSPASW